MRVHLRILLVGLVLASCKPVELRQTELLNRKIFTHTVDQDIRAELQEMDQKLSPKSDRSYFWFGKGRINQTQGGYSGKLLHGEYIVFYKGSKKMAEQGRFEQGLKTGPWLSWNGNGLLKEKSFYKSGFLNGPLVHFDSLGKPLDTLKYRKGMLVVKKASTDTAGFFSRIIHKLFKKKK